MSITLEARYEKRLPLPLLPYSSHAYALTVRAELKDLNELTAESQRLHRLLQDAVDREIQVIGFVPQDAEPPMLPTPTRNEAAPLAPAPVPVTNGATWQCSGRQQELILTIAQERSIALEQAGAIARERFGRDLHQLNRSQASRMISLLTG